MSHQSILGLSLREYAEKAGNWFGLWLITLFYVASAHGVYGQSLETRVASIRSHPWLVRFDGSTTNLFGEHYSLSLGPAPGYPSQGFLPVDLSSGDTNRLVGFCELQSTSLTPPLDLIGEFVIKLPSFEDLDNDGIADFFQPKHDIPVTQTEGFFRDTVGGPHQLIATWYRDGDQGNTGKVEFQMASQALGLTVTFRTRFEVYYYVGTLRYTTRSGVGNLEMYHFNQASENFVGVVPFSSIQGNTNQIRMNQFTVTDDQGVDGIHENVESLSLEQNGFVGNIHLQFSDARLSASSGSVAWRFSVFDRQFADVLPITAPTLRLLSQNGNGLVLEITADQGGLMSLETTHSLLQPWLAIKTVDLSTTNKITVSWTNDVSSAGEYFRVKRL